MSGCIAAVSKDVDTFKTATFTTDRTRMRSFSGACIVYRRIIEEFYRIVWALNDSQ